MPKTQSVAKMVAEVKSKKELRLALERVEEIDAEIDPLLEERSVLHAAATTYAAAENIVVMQLEDSYWRLIKRATTGWDSKKLKKIVGKKQVMVKGRKRLLWNQITVRKIDPKLVDEAVAKGWLTTKRIEGALVEFQHAPFIQRYKGEA